MVDCCWYFLTKKNIFHKTDRLNYRLIYKYYISNVDAFSKLNMYFNYLKLKKDFYKLHLIGL